VKVALVCPDLLFGSKVEGALRAAGHEVTRETGGADVVVVDLDAGIPVPHGPTVGFYPHVNQELRRRAEAAGYTAVVPRSRMARETAAVVERAAATA
jgi:hypothetical protein